MCINCSFEFNIYFKLEQHPWNGTNNVIIVYVIFVTEKAMVLTAFHDNKDFIKFF